MRPSKNTSKKTARPSNARRAGKLQSPSEASGFVHSAAGSPLPTAHSNDDRAVTASFTIVAAATAPVRSGVGILRVSGPAALAVANRLAPEVPQLPVPRHAYLTSLCDSSGAVLDRGLFIYFEAPQSYTGEDVVELQVHGSPRLLELLERELLRDPRIKLAEPGEFTKRAFLSGRLDLTQAEAVAELVAAESEAALRAAAQQMAGGLSRRLSEIRDPLIALRGELEGLLNFPVETEDEVVDPQPALRVVLGKARQLIEDADRGRLLRRGTRVALVGPVNAGKSTLFNRLLGEGRALVDADPGTTRDVIEGRVELQGVPVSLLDTAGLQVQPGRLEALGIERTREAASSSDLVIFVLPPDTTNDEESRWRRELNLRSAIEVRSKSDLVRHRRPDESYVSGLTGEGVEALRKRSVSTLLGNEVLGAVLLTSERHQEALRRLSEHLGDALSA